MTPTIFSTPICSYCEKAKDWFKENNIEYIEIDISQNAGARDAILRKTGMMTVPVIQIYDDFIVGFDVVKISKLLDV